MAGKQCADIVFCLDASGSMSHTFREVAKHVGTLIDSLNESSQMKWDVRFDFLAFRSGNGMHAFNTVRLSTLNLMAALYGETDNQNRASVFTRDINQFRRALLGVATEGEEAPLIALDCAMDFPWRPADNCHRVIILLSDEPVETGTEVAEQVRAIPGLINKLHAKRIKLFITAPESDAYYTLSEADRSEYDIVEETQGSGLKSVNFSKMLASIGKSVSVSLNQQGGSDRPMPLFEQDEWIPAEGDLGTDY